MNLYIHVTPDLPVWQTANVSFKEVSPQSPNSALWSSTILTIQNANTTLTLIFYNSFSDEKVKGEHHPFPRQVGQNERGPTHASFFPNEPENLWKTRQPVVMLWTQLMPGQGSLLLLQTPIHHASQVHGVHQHYPLQHIWDQEGLNGVRSHILESSHCNKPHWSVNRIKYEPVVRFPGVPSVT